MSTIDGGPLSTAPLEVTVAENTESQAVDSGTSGVTTTDLATEIDRTTVSYIDDGISESTGATQDETSGEPGDDADEESELSYDSPREEHANNNDKRCISAKLVEQIQKNAEMNHLATNASICRWTYTYDVNSRRVPELLVKAVCSPKPESFPASERCEPVSYPIPVRKMDANGNWVSCTESLVVGCVLASTDPPRRGITPTDATPRQRPVGDNQSAQTPSSPDNDDADV